MLYMVASEVICSKTTNNCRLRNDISDNERIFFVIVQLLLNYWILNHTTSSALDCPLCFICTLYL